MLKNLFFFFLILSQSLLAQQQTWPDITSEAKPWTRMWWPGSIGSKTDITAALEKYKAAGLGGVEVTVIYGVKGQEDKFVSYLSTEWMDLFSHFLKEGERLGLGIDLANASGWPFGGPWVNSEDACRNINYKSYSLKEGEKLTEKVEFIQQPFMRPIGQRPDNEMFIEFQKRRGYDLKEHLPALFQKDEPEKNERILSDYRQTISDLILETFTTRWTKGVQSSSHLPTVSGTTFPHSIII